MIEDKPSFRTDVKRVTNGFILALNSFRNLVIIWFFDSKNVDRLAAMLT
jgi:hypothetical protein